MATLQNTVINDTGRISLPVDTTANRPSPTTGNLRMNNSYPTPVLEFYNGSTWQAVTGYSEGTIGTGGTISFVNGGIVHSFTSVGSATFTPAFTGTVQVLVVAGGGGGAGSHGGGGGGGGVIYNSSFPVSSGTPYGVTVGDRGSGQGYGPFATNGGNSVFSTLTAIGGGGGGPWDQGGTDSRSGGSGGGAGSSSQDGSRFRVSGGLGTNGQGFPGGSGCRFNRQSDNAHLSGGGGGAGGPGQEASDNREDGKCANGGPGAACEILGTTLYWGGGGGAGPHLSPGGGGSGGIGGGGGGAAHHGSPAMPGDFPRLRGRGGGQALNSGDQAYGQVQGGNAGANTGGGGGGGNAGGGTQFGGTGIVIIRY